MDVTAGFQYAPTEKSAMTSEFLEELRKPWHAIVLGSVNWDWFDPAVKDALWDKVRSGTGLVMIHPEGDDSTLEQVLKTVRPAGNRAFFTEQQAVGFPLLPWLQNAELSTGQLDNGRIAVMDYRLDGHNTWRRTVSSLFPPHKEHAPRHDDMPWWEPYYALLTRAVLSSIHAPAIEISGIRTEHTDRDVVTFIVDLDGQITGSHVHATCIGPGNRSVVEVDAPVNAETGTATVTLHAPFMTGAHFVWLWVRGADGRDRQWGAYLFDVPGITAAIATDSVRYERGDRVRGRVELSDAPPTGAHIEVSLIDTFGRMVDQVRVDTAGQDLFSLKSEGVYSRTARVVARLVSDREQGSRVECEDSRTVAIADEIDDSDYVVGIWASYYNQVFQLPWAHHMLTLQHEMGIDFAYMAHATAEYYYQAYAEHNMWPVPEEMHRIWFKERDPYLTLDLNDPSFQSKYSQSIDKAARDGYRWGAYDFSVGDECGYALRYNETTFAAFREWLKPRHETLEHLNRVWGTQYAAWEEVEPKRLQEIAPGTGVAPHLEFCTFSDELFAEAFQNAGDIVRAIDFRNRIGLTGTRDPGYHIGYDWHRLMQSITHLAFYERSSDHLRSPET